MDHPLILHRHPWISMDFQGLGEPVGHVGGTGQHIMAEPLGWETLTHTLYRKQEPIHARLVRKKPRKA